LKKDRIYLKPINLQNIRNDTRQNAVNIKNQNNINVNSEVNIINNLLSKKHIKKKLKKIYSYAKDNKDYTI
jgi:hypothetical protein